jgi:uncharacterized protein YjbI with pentapeptide repeats
MTTNSVIQESQLRERLSKHKIWLKSPNKTSESSVASQLVLADSVIINITIADENLSCVEFIRCKISNAHFKNCDFSYGLLIDNVFVNCSFINCNFVKADLSGTKASGTDFSGSDFTRADLTDTLMTNANLTNCRFSWAWLVKTDLRDAILERAQLQDARIVEAKAGIPEWQLGLDNRKETQHAR